MRIICDTVVLIPLRAVSGFMASASDIGRFWIEKTALAPASLISFTLVMLPAMAITVATRYIHSHASILHRDDYDNAVKLVVEVIKRLDRDKVNEITFN